MSQEPERSPSGAPVLRHHTRPAREVPAAANEAGPDIRAHVERHVGPVAATFQELISELVRLDVLVVPPGPQRDFYTLVTSGMSARPMHPPEGLDECRYAELVLCLPPDWPILEREALADEERYWPLRWLKTLARFPHEYDTWLYWQHTVPNSGDPPRPFAAGTRMSSILLLDPALLAPELSRLELPDGREIAFFALYPLLPEELDFKLREGADALELALRRAGVTELLDPQRPSAV